jgi:hypothetical protein
MMETSPELEFEFFLAQKLGKTVGQLREQVSNIEFLQWHTYYARKAQRAELERLKSKH